VERHGKSLDQLTCERDLEGIVAKHRNGLYDTSKREWVSRILYTQAEGRAELLKSCGVEVQRTIALVVIGLVLLSCDPTHRISASKELSSAIERKCIVDALRMESSVRQAEFYDARRIAADLIIPQDIKSPRPETYFVVEEREKNKAGKPDINFSINDVPYAAKPEYQAYVQKTLEELRDRTIERCGGK
jgi:hypothetical protein